jgi:hypothetical protein
MPLEEIDSLEILVIIDNEVDPISKYPQEGVTAYGNLADLARDSPYHPDDRGKGVHEVRMDQICCGAHGLSLMIVGFCVSFIHKLVIRTSFDSNHSNLLPMKHIHFPAVRVLFISSFFPSASNYTAHSQHITEELSTLVQVWRVQSGKKASRVQIHSIFSMSSSFQKSRTRH